jgi:hypothetical protein
LIVLALCFGVGLWLARATGVRAGEGEVPGTVGVTYGPVLPGHAVYPKQELPLRFSHQAHLGRGLDCEQCHTQVAHSRRSADDNIPRGSTCDGCHGKQHPRPPGEPAKCQTCHTRVDEGRVTAAVDVPAPHLKFNHEMHLTKGATCTTCHGDMTKVRLGTVLQLPSEETCLDCHDGVKATQRCGACHPQKPDGTLMTRPGGARAVVPLLPRDDLWGAAHDLSFVEDHVGIAKANPGLCDNCHEKDFCQDCHNGALRPMRIHSGDYLTTHALDARARTQDCQSCHRFQTDCRACHERLGMGTGEGTKFGVGSGLRFHPDGWAGPPGMPQGHSFPAQRNIGACASCHDEDSCLSCHATTGAARPGLDVSPHGRDFASSARCDSLARTSRRACLKCHAPGDPKLDCLPM